MREIREKGFTLIELLIVIVIIGILAGVLIAIIDPAAQQNRARDANTQATMNKVALATQGYISAYGDAPNDVQFFGGLSNATEVASDCSTGGTDFVCNFTVSGSELPAGSSANGCDTSGWTGTGTTDCFFHYDGQPTVGATTEFELYAKSHGIAQTVFLYDNAGPNAGEIQHCDDSNPPASCVAPN